MRSNDPAQLPGPPRGATRSQTATWRAGAAAAGGWATRPSLEAVVGQLDVVAQVGADEEIGDHREPQ